MLHGLSVILASDFGHVRKREVDPIISRPIVGPKTAAPS
jgi:hypothetical protein